MSNQKQPVTDTSWGDEIRRRLRKWNARTGVSQFSRTKAETNIGLSVLSTTSPSFYGFRASVGNVTILYMYTRWTDRRPIDRLSEIWAREFRDFFGRPVLADFVTYRNRIGLLSRGRFAGYDGAIVVRSVAQRANGDFNERRHDG